jgi:hypothetical protein
MFCLLLRPLELHAARLSIAVCTPKFACAAEGSLLEGAGRRRLSGQLLWHALSLQNGENAFLGGYLLDFGSIGSGYCPVRGRAPIDLDLARDLCPAGDCLYRGSRFFLKARMLFNPNSWIRDRQSFSRPPCFQQIPDFSEELFFGRRSHWRRLCGRLLEPINLFDNQKQY